MNAYKMIELVGTSPESLTDAIEGAVARAAETVDDLQWFEVKEIRGRIQDGAVAEYQVKLDVSFLLHARERARAPVAAKGSRKGARRHARE